MRAWNRGERLWSAGDGPAPDWLNFIHVYSIAIFLGVIVSFLAIIYFWKRQKYPMDILQIMLIIIVPTSILGARFWYVLWDGGWERFFIFEGLSIHGGVFFSTLAVSIYAYHKRHIIDYKTAFSMILPNVILGQMIGRWGNFANHEVYGTVTTGESLNWLGALKDHMYITDSTGTFYRQPFFLYEFITSGAGWAFMVGLLLFKNWAKPGVVGGVYLVWYGTVRVAMEPLRAEIDKMGVAEVGFPISLFVAALSIIGGLWLIIYWQWLCVPLKRYFAKKYLDFLNAHNNAPLGRKAKVAQFFLVWLTRLFNTKEYERITPIKPRRTHLLWGPKRDTKKVWRFKWVDYDNDKVLRLQRLEIENRVIIWVPKEVRNAIWSKRELNRGTRDPKAAMKERLQQ